MSENESGTEKSERPTGKRLSKAHSEGNYPKSQESNATLVLAVGIFALYLTGEAILADFRFVMEQSFRHAGIIELNSETVLAYSFEGAVFIVKMILPLLFAIALAGFVSNVAQTGWIWNTKPLVPDFAKLFNFTGAIKRLFLGKQAIINLAKNFVKVVICLWIGYSTVKEDVPTFIEMINLDITEIFDQGIAITLKLIIRLLSLFVVLAIIDIFYTRWKYIEDLKMTKQEVKEEHKQAETNPEVKKRQMQMQFDIFLRSMKKSVPKADVIITNPIHVAIALKYDPDNMRAPQVVGKGLRLIADQIREIAKEHNIPIVENPPLARALYKKVEIGSEISDEFFKAVAEVLAFVYRLKNEK